MTHDVAQMTAHITTNTNHVTRHTTHDTTWHKSHDTRHGHATSRHATHCDYARSRDTSCQVILITARSHPMIHHVSDITVTSHYVKHLVTCHTMSRDTLHRAAHITTTSHGTSHITTSANHVTWHITTLDTSHHMTPHIM
jgi:hypothetical protein